MSVPDKEFIRQAFDSITPRYDLLNQILSFGMAERWRKYACEIVLEGTGSFQRGQAPFSKGLAPFPQEKVPVPLAEKGASPNADQFPQSGNWGSPGYRSKKENHSQDRPRTILDLGCGTGKFIECFLKAQKWDQAVGVDFSSAMLEKARRAVVGNVTWLQEDFDALPFLESSFDLEISGFTLRSVQKLPEFLGRIHRILNPGGKAVFLDLTRPRSFWARLFFYPYLKFALPFLGWLISGNRMAYGFLSGSIQHFQASEETICMMQALGYRDCISKSFAFGAATLIIGKK